MSLDPRVDIGHVHLKVADIDRSLGFYRDILGFDVMQRIGDEAAFISAGGYHHHLGLNTWESRGGSPPPPEHDRALPRRDPLPGPRAARERAQAAGRGELAGRRRHRPRRLRGDLPARSGRKRDRALPRPARGRVAARRRRRGLAMISEPLDLQALLERGGLMAKGYAEGPAAEEAERRLRGARARRRLSREAELRSGGLRLDRGQSPSGTSSAGATRSIRTSCSPPGKAWGITVVRATV